MHSAPLTLLPGTVELLTSGGDARIELNSAGYNAYGCQATPDSQLISFSSSTATVISTTGFDCAQRFQHSVQEALQYSSAAQVFAETSANISAQLTHLCGVTKQTQLILSPSGTDVHGLVAQHLIRIHHTRLRIIMIDSNETGRGVAIALQHTQGSSAPELLSLPLRDNTGELLNNDFLNAMLDTWVRQAVAIQQPVLVVLIDQSKTGLLAPTLQNIVALHQQHQELMTVLVDACQFRLAPVTLRAYLAQGFLVAITGSKFLTGPSFSAALLINNDPQLLASTHTHTHAQLNFGLLLRWQVALHEFNAFQALSNAAISNFITAFAIRIRQRLHTDSVFTELPNQALERHCLVPEPCWDQLPTIFSFVVNHSAPPHPPLSADETHWLYQQLPHDNDLSTELTQRLPRCQLGQPVFIGQQPGITLSALRISISARLIVTALQSPQHAQHIINDALLVLDKVAYLSHRLASVPQSRS
ncbi:MAG: hypothetical protein ACOYM1_08570 [Methylovulum sp.]